MLVTSCSGAPGTVTLPPRSQMLSETLSPGPSWRSPPASSWERAAQCPEISMPAPLTLPWHLTAHRRVLSPVGSGVPLSPAARGLSRRGSPCSGLATHRRGPTRWVGAHSPGHTASWTAACLSKSRAQALAQLGLCPLPFPPADMPAAARRHRRLPGRQAKRVSA